VKAAQGGALVGNSEWWGYAFCRRAGDNAGVVEETKEMVRK
jgi:hypothetical protein